MRSSSTATDDAGLVERLGERVLVVEGDPRAFKVTTPGDLEAAARLLRRPDDLPGRCIPRALDRAVHRPGVRLSSAR